MRELKHTSLLDVLPPNLAEDETLRNVALALDGEMQRTTELSRMVLLLARIDELDDATIDLLAKQFKVDFYDADTPLEQKRELVRTSIAWHRKKGTPGAVQHAVDTLISGAKVQEYWEYGGKPYFFMVGGITGPIVNEMTISSVVRAINISKNTRSHLEEIRFERNHQRNLHTGSAVQMGYSIEVRPHKLATTTTTTTLYVGDALRIHKEVIIHG